jgi:hypothetical protein
MNISGKALYWSHHGPNQVLYDRLYEMYVPAKGKADLWEGEVLRCMSNLYYDLFNNGGGNFDVRIEDYHILRGLLDDPKAVERLDILFDRRDTLTNEIADQLIEDCLDQAQNLIRERLNQGKEY